MQNQPEPCQENQVSFSEFPASADQESETHHCGELSLYEIEANSSMAGWEAIRDGLLSAVTESQGMRSSQMCVLCDESSALRRCRQCEPRSYYCQICFDTVHSWSSFLHAAGLCFIQKISWRGEDYNFNYAYYWFHITFCVLHYIKFCI